MSHGADVTFSHSIVDSCLAILVLHVDVLSTQRVQVGDERIVTLTCGVEDRRLLQCIFIVRIDSKLDEDFDHLKGKLVAPDNTGGEGKRLAEVFWLVNDLTNVDAGLANEADNFVDFTALYFLKEGLVQRVRLPSDGLVSLGLSRLGRLDLLSLFDVGSHRILIDLLKRKLSVRSLSEECYDLRYHFLLNFLLTDAASVWPLGATDTPVEAY